METKPLVFRSWDDLVFAYRNKSYGAYAIRKAYSNRIILGFALSKAIVLVIIFGSMIKESEPALVAVKILDKKGDFIFHDYVPPIKPQPPAPRPHRAQNANQNTTIQVVTTPVEPPVDIPTTDSSPSSTGEDTGEIVGTEPGTGTVITSVEVPTEPEVRNIAEVMPSYEGGMEAIIKFVKRHLRYPASARRQGIDGTVFVSFVVGGDGAVRQVKVLRGIHVDCDEEAIRVISMLPKWKGGMHNGNPVSVKMVLPIKFSLQ